MKEQATFKDHAALADKFNADEARVDWHDKTLWFIREKRDRAAWQLAEWEALRETASQIKDNVLANLPRLSGAIRSAGKGKRRNRALGGRCRRAQRHCAQYYQNNRV